MPRLTDTQFLKSRKRLARLWLHAPEAFSYLSPTEQWQLHDYYQPSRDLTDDRLLADRAVITSERPSLPHQAGRTLAKLDERTAAFALRKLRAIPAGRPTNDRVLSIRPLVRPHSDRHKLAKIVLQLAKELGAEQRRKGAIVCKAKPLQTSVRLELLPGVEPAFALWRIPTSRS